jgi:hypothetical protein
MKKLLLTAALVLALPAVAHAGNVTMVARDIPLGARALQSAQAPMRFNMLGVHWRGRGGVEYRTHRLRGGWRAWRAVDDDARPDRRSAERDSWRDGNLDWTGASDRVQLRIVGEVRRLRAYYLWSRVDGTPARRLSLAGSPTIIPRAGWQADEKIKRAKPLYAPAVRLAVVHHTAGTNSYSPAQAAAIVRGIEVYHVKGNGWNDIGYNFLVDRFGTVYEGRYGGIEKNVIGAHAEGFNTGTTGVALIGNYTYARPPKAQQDALVKLLAWRLDVAHVDPRSTVVYTSGGNLKWRAGRAVTLRAISGHRDTGPSECPGSGVYGLLPGIAQRVAKTGLPKLYSPVASGALGGPIRFQARLSSVLPWTVSVIDALGTVVAQGSGRSGVVDWTWDSFTAGTGPFAWTIDAGPSVRPATGSLGGFVPAGPVLTGLAAAPSVIAPNADGSGDAATITFTLGSPALVTAQVLDPVGTPLFTLLSEKRPAGANSIEWGAHVLPDGRYTFVVTAKPAVGKAVSQSVAVVVDRTLAAFAASPLVVSPNGDGFFDTMTFSFQLAQNAPVRLELRQYGSVVATAFNGPLAVGPHVLAWDGTNAGVRVPDGAYDAVAVVTDQLGEVALTTAVTVDTTPPVLTLLDPARLRFQLSEPATVTLLVNNQRIVKVEPKGAFSVPWVGAVATVSAVAQDAGGNIGAAVKSP